MRKKGILIIMATSIIALTIVFFCFNPEKSVWFPKCPFYILTGYKCPACGSQRAIYNLLHLHIKDAISYNPFLVVSIPYIILLILTSLFIPQNRCPKLRAICYHPITIKAYLILLIIWWILRNIYFF